MHGYHIQGFTICTICILFREGSLNIQSDCFAIEKTPVCRHVTLACTHVELELDCEREGRQNCLLVDCQNCVLFMQK